MPDYALEVGKKISFSIKASRVLETAFNVEFLDVSKQVLARLEFAKDGNLIWHSLLESDKHDRKVGTFTFTPPASVTFAVQLCDQQLKITLEKFDFNKTSSEDLADIECDPVLKSIYALRLIGIDSGIAFQNTNIRTCKCPESSNCPSDTEKSTVENINTDSHDKGNCTHVDVTSASNASNSSTSNHSSHNNNNKSSKSYKSQKSQKSQKSSKSTKSSKANQSQSPTVSHLQSTSTSSNASDVIIVKNEAAQSAIKLFTIYKTRVMSKITRSDDHKEHDKCFAILLIVLIISLGTSIIWACITPSRKYVKAIAM